MLKKDIFIKYIKFLEHNEFIYCVVGDVRGYPEIIKRDVDIVVSEKDIGRIVRSTKEFSRQEKLLLIQCFRHEYNAWRFVLCSYTEKYDYETIQLDVCGDYVRDSRKYIGSEWLLAKRMRYNDPFEGGGFYVPSSSKAFVFYLIKKISKGYIDLNQVDYLQELFAKSPEASLSALNEYFGDKDTALVSDLIEKKDIQQLNMNMVFLKRKANRCNFFPIKNIIKEGLRLLERMIKPSGFMLVFLGPDGVGKSSVSNGVINKVKSEVFSGGVKCMHLRPGIFDARQKVGYSKPNTGVMVIESPYAEKGRGWLVSMLKVAYFAVDYIIGYWLVVRPVLIRSGFFIFDRYYYDLYLDAKRYRFGGSIWLAKMVGHILPKPDLILVLDANAVEIHRRKQEVTLEETELQRRSYRCFAEKNVSSVLLDTEQSLNKVVNKAVVSVFIVLDKRLRK